MCDLCTGKCCTNGGDIVILSFVLNESVEEPRYGHVTHRYEN